MVGQVHLPPSKREKEPLVSFFHCHILLGGEWKGVEERESMLTGNPLSRYG